MEDDHSPWFGIDPGSLHRVVDPAPAVIVGDPLRSRFLQPFLGRDRTITEAAAEVGCTPNTMLYRVRRMVAVGLLLVVATRTRPGRSIKVYRSSHDGYFVPTEAMPYDDLAHRVREQGRGLIEELFDAYTAVLFRSDHSGRVLARDATGAVWSSDLPPSTNHRGQPAYLTDGIFWLTTDEATELRDLLASVTSRAATTPDDGTTMRQPYLIYRALLPR